jgi:hypothetical protein
MSLSSQAVLQLAPSHFCNWHFNNLNASLKLSINSLNLSGSNDYVLMSDLKLETVSEYDNRALFSSP